MLVESELHSRAILSHLIESTKILKLGWRVQTQREAERLLSQCEPQLLICATQLADGDGFELLPRIRPTTEVVMAAHDPGFAARAYDLDVADYLVKPVRRERFEQMARRLVRRRSDHSGQTEALDTLIVADGKGEQLVDLQDLMAITAIGGNYTELHLTSGTSFEARRPITTWQRTLPHDTFVRTHRCAIVNLAHVERVERRDSSHLALRLRSSSIEIPVSRRLARNVRGAMQGWACAV
jgi:two-component system LytT family response regulator